MRALNIKTDIKNSTSNVFLNKIKKLLLYCLHFEQLKVH